MTTPLEPAPIIVRRCMRKGKWFRGCKFEPRYEVGPSTITIEQIKALEVFPVNIGTTIKEFRTRTYVCDVCVRCGKRVDPNANKL